MSTHALLELARETVRAIAAAPARGASITQSPLRLSDLIEIRSPIEDLGSGRVSVYEYTPTLLSPRSPQPPRRSALASGRVVLAGVDSGGRAIETPLAGLAVAAVAATLSAPLPGAGRESLAWPPIPPPGRGPPLAGPPFIRVLPNWLGWEPALPHFAVARNPAGERYGPDYSMAQALDEARVALENWALRALANLAEAGAARPGGLAVLVDGPVYLVPGALASSGAPEVYRRAWESLLEERVEAVSRLERLGVPVVGVVKRVSRSRIMSRASGLERLVEPCVGPGEYSDEMAVYRAYASCARRIPGRIYKTPTLRVDAGPAGYKLVDYLAIPPGKWQTSPSGIRVVRLEYTERSLELARGALGAEPYHIYAYSSLLSGSLQPLVILASDRRARTTARAVARLLERELARAGVPPSYETALEERLERARGW
jgi:hypothetical protein